MKRRLFLCTCVMALLLTSCGSQAQLTKSKAVNPAKNVVTTEFKPHKYQGVSPKNLRHESIAEKEMRHFSR